MFEEQLQRMLSEASTMILVVFGILLLSIVLGGVWIYVTRKRY